MKRRRIKEDSRCFWFFYKNFSGLHSPKSDDRNQCKTQVWLIPLTAFKFTWWKITPLAKIWNSLYKRCVCIDSTLSRGISLSFSLMTSFSKYLNSNNLPHHKPSRMTRHKASSAHCAAHAHRPGPRRPLSPASVPDPDRQVKSSGVDKVAPQCSTRHWLMSESTLNFDPLTNLPATCPVWMNHFFTACDIWPLVRKTKAIKSKAPR